jgi:hypothetical protein
MTQFELWAGLFGVVVAVLAFLAYMGSPHSSSADSLHKPAPKPVAKPKVPAKPAPKHKSAVKQPPPKHRRRSF